MENSNFRLWAEKTSVIPNGKLFLVTQIESLVYKKNSRVDFKAKSIILPENHLLYRLASIPPPV